MQNDLEVIDRLKRIEEICKEEGFILVREISKYTIYKDKKTILISFDNTMMGLQYLYGFQYGRIVGRIEGRLESLGDKNDKF